MAEYTEKSACADTRNNTHPLNRSSRPLQNCSARCFKVQIAETKSIDRYIYIYRHLANNIVENFSKFNHFKADFTEQNKQKINAQH